MDKSVSTSGIRDSANYLRSIINDLSSSYSDIRGNIERMAADINLLHQYNGADASETFDRILDSHLPSQKILEVYKYVWDIQVNGGENVESLLSSSCMLGIEDHISLLENDSNLLDGAANAIDEMIAHIQNILGNSIDNSLFMSGKVLDYLKTYCLFSSVSNMNLNEIKNDGYTIQGVTTINGEVLVTAHGEKGDRSRIYLYDKYGKYKGTVILNNSAHVGGITFDKKNGIIYVSGGKGKVNAYSYEAISDAFITSDVLDLNGKKVDLSDIVVRTNDLTVGEINVNGNTESVTEVGKASSVYFYDDSLYVSTFNGDEAGEMVKFQLDYRNGQVYATKDAVYSIPSKTQGIAITDYGGKKYLLSSQSIGATNSYITLSEFKDNNQLEHLNTKTINNSGLQGISIDDAHNVVLSYENYSGALNKVDSAIDTIKSRDNSSISTDTFGRLKDDILNYHSGIGDAINSTISDITGKFYNMNH